MHDFLEALNSRCGWGCAVKSYDGWNLVLSSGSSFEYASPLVVFSGVTYVSCPIEFSHPRFRLASEIERQGISEVVPLEAQDFLFVIEAETMAGIGNRVFFVAAESAAFPGNA